MKRRILCFVLTMAMVLSMLVVLPAVTVSADTYNASDNPVLITTAADLKAFRNAVNGGNTFEGKVVKLCGDIDISDASWSPIAKNGYAFCGSFDGQGHTITGLYQSYGRFTGDGGLFGFVQVPTTGGTIYIKNLSLTKKASEKMNSSNGGYSAGTLVSIVAPRSGVAGTVNIENVYSSVDFDSSGSLMTAFGGIVGTISGTTGQRDNNVTYDSGTSITLNIDSCQYAGNAGSPSAGSTWYGGILGCNNFVRCNQTVNITNCLVTGEIHIWGNGALSNYDDNGGIMGYVKGNGGASGCKATISLLNNIFAGKILWRRDSGQTGGTSDQGFILGEITSGYLNGKVTMTNNYYIVTTPEGGLNVTAGLGAGSSYATITNLTAKTLDEVKALTSSNFTDGSKWHFESGKVPQPASIYETFFEDVEPSIFDDMTQSEFVITNDTQMAEFQAKVNGGTTFAGKTIKLGADVALNGRIGATSSLAFSGNFDGQGHTVTITQSITNPDGNGGLFDFVRVPADSTLTIQNVHLAGTMTLTNNTTGMGYCGALISAVDAGTTGSGGTINITNVWNTVRINGGNANAWNSMGGFIGFVRHADGLKQITINIDSCLWDGVINCGPAMYHVGGFIGYTGNNKAGRQPTINITNSVAAGTIMANINGWNQQFGVLTSFLKGSFSDDASAKLTVNIENVISLAKATFANATGSGSTIGLIEQVDGTTELNLSNLYYKTFERTGVEGDFPVVASGSAASSTNVLEKTTIGIYELTSSAFSTPAKWSIASTHFPCPQGLVDTFGVPSSLAVSEYDLYDEFNIGTDEQMAAFAANVNSGKTYEGKTVKLTADVALNTTVGASSSLAFSGNFNGQGHTVTITQSITNPDGNGGLFSFVRVPENSALTIQNVHLAGTMTLTNNTTGKGYCGALISTVDAGTTGSSGTLNVTNVWNTVRINAGASNTWYGVSAFIGFVRHAAGLKPLTINMDSCLWDGVLNFGPASEYCGSFVGYTGNQSGANRPLTLNITNSVVAGTMMLNTGYSDDSGLLTGYLKGNGTNSATSAVTANFHDIVVTGRITSSVDLTVSKWNTSLFAVSGTTSVDMANLYYIPRTVRNKTLTVYDGSGGTVTGTATEKTGIGMYAMTTSAFSNASKWNKTEGYYACPAGIVSTFGEVPDTLYVEEYDRSDTFSISTTAAFLAFRDAVNDGKNYSGKTVQLAADIDLAGESWREIGRASGTSSAGSNVFKGTFDGKGYTIFNMTTYLEPTSGFVDMQGGLFGNLGDGAIVKDFTLTGSMTIYNRSSGSGASSYFGSVANAVSGTVLIQGVHSSVDITTKNGKNPDTDAWAGGATYAAGLVGFILHNNNANLTIDGCEYSGTINCANTANGAAGIMSFDGNNNNSSTKVITISDTIFSGRMTINDNGGTYAYEKVGGIFGYLKTASLTISNTTSGGKVYFNRSKAWSATNISAGQIIGQVDSGASYTIDDSVAYTPIYLYTALPNSDETKFVLGEIGYLNGVYATNGEDNTDAIIGGMEAIAVAYDETDGTGIRFTASFFNKASCTGGGSSSANFGIFLMTKLVYDELGGEDASYSAVNALVGTGAVYKVYAAKYRNEGGAYTVNVIVMNLNEASEMAGELVAIPYAGDSLGNATVASYNELFAD